MGINNENSPNVFYFMDSRKQKAGWRKRQERGRWQRLVAIERSKGCMVGVASNEVQSATSFSLPRALFFLHQHSPHCHGNIFLGAKHDMVTPMVHRATVQKAPGTSATLVSNIRRSWTHDLTSEFRNSSCLSLLVSLLVRKGP